MPFHPLQKTPQQVRFSGWLILRLHPIAIFSGTFNLGVNYSGGQGVQKNATLAYMWTYVAALQGNKTAKKNLIRVARIGSMSPADVTKAQKLARECVEKKYKGC
jgi:TPR repeat protein